MRLRTKKVLFGFMAVLTAIFCALPQSAVALVYTADPNSGAQWHLNTLGVHEAWGVTKGNSDLVVAVIDAGVDIDNPDLKENIWVNRGDMTLDGRDDDGNGYPDDINGWDFVSGTNDPRPDVLDPDAALWAIHHGTVTASIIGAMADNGVAGVGISPRVKIMPLRALASNGFGDIADITEAIRYATAKRVDVINLSLVGTQAYNRSMYEAIQAAYNAGILVVGATGNGVALASDPTQVMALDLDAVPIYPACYRGADGADIILGVTALDQSSVKVKSANYGADCTDLSAPGHEIRSLLYYKPTVGLDQIFSNDGRIGRFALTGTSFAAPMVSAAAILVKAINPRYSVADIRSILLQSAESVDALNPAFAGKLGAGRVNAARAVALAQGGTIKPQSSIRQGYVMITPQSAGGSVVRIMRNSGTEVMSFDAYTTRFRSGVRIAAGDLDGDGIDEIVVAPGPGAPPEVKIFSSDGTLVRSFFPYDKAFRGGVSVAVGDLNGNGTAEIVIAPATSSASQIKIFSPLGKLVGIFSAYDRSHRGGINLAVGDIDGDGKEEIITAPGPGRETRVRAFYANGKEAFSFNAFPRSVTGGVSVATGDLDGDGADEIVVAPAKNAQPEVRVYSSTGDWLRAFMVYDTKFRGGVNLSVFDSDGDGQNDIVTAPGTGGGPHVRFFDGFGKLKQSFIGFDPKFTGGVIISGVVL